MAERLSPPCSDPQSWFAWVYRNDRPARLVEAAQSLDDVTVLDIFEAQPRSERFEDGIHPTIPEHQRIAARVLEVIRASQLTG